MGLENLSKVDWQTILGVASAIIALCAFAISVWQGVVSRKHNRMSVRPHLTTWRHSSASRGYYQVDLINNGIGPALIEKFSVKIDGKVLPGTELEAIDKAMKILFPNTSYTMGKAYVGRGYAMAPKERCTIVSVQFTGGAVPSPEIVEHALLSRADLEVRYKSFYGEEFKLETEKLKA